MRAKPTRKAYPMATKRHVRIVFVDFGKVLYLMTNGIIMRPVTSSGVKLTGENGLNAPAL